MSVFDEEIYEGLADLITAHFFGHLGSRRLPPDDMFHRRRHYRILELYQAKKNERGVITKSPERVPDSGLEGHTSISRHRRFVEQSQQLGCAQSQGSGGLTFHNTLKFEFSFH